MEVMVRYSLRLKTFSISISLFVCSMLLLSGCMTVKKMLFGAGSVSKVSIKAYLDMPGYAEVNADSIRSAVLLALPVGVSESQIYGYLNRHHVSQSPKDFMAYYLPKNRDNEIICILSYNSAPGLKGTFHIKYLLSEQGILKDVTVTESQDNL